MLKKGLVFSTVPFKKIVSRLLSVTRGALVIVKSTFKLSMFVRLCLAMSELMLLTRVVEIVYLASFTIKERILFWKSLVTD